MPQFTHDCQDCTFLGSIIDRNNMECDLYVHVDEHDTAHSTFIARYSDEGSDYISTPLFLMGENLESLPTPLAIAFTLADARGLLEPVEAVA